MAYSTYTAPSHEGFSFTAAAAALGKRIAGVLASVTRAMVINSTAQQRLDQVTRLQSLSDEALAARGLKRQDIVHHVFRDLFWS